MSARYAFSMATKYVNDYEAGLETLETLQAHAQEACMLLDLAVQGPSGKWYHFANGLLTLSDTNPQLQ